MSMQDEPDLRAIEPLAPESGLCGGPGQISCDEANELLQRYLDHVGDSDTDLRVAGHLGDCPPCESEAVMYQRIISSLERCRPHVPSDVEQRIQRFCTELCTGEHDDDVLADD